MRSLTPASKSQTRFLPSPGGWGELIFHNWGTAAVYSEHASLCCFSNLEKLLSPLIQSSLLIWYIVVFPHTVWTARRHPAQVFSGEGGCSERWCEIDDRCERRSDDVCLVDQLLHLTGTKLHAAGLELMSIFIVCIFNLAMFWSLNLVWLAESSPGITELIGGESKQEDKPGGNQNKSSICKSVETNWVKRVQEKFRILSLKLRCRTFL